MFAQLKWGRAGRERSLMAAEQLARLGSARCPPARGWVRSRSGLPLPVLAARRAAPVGGCLLARPECLITMVRGRTPRPPSLLAAPALASIVMQKCSAASPRATGRPSRSRPRGGCSGIVWGRGREDHGGAPAARTPSLPAEMACTWLQTRWRLRCPGRTWRQRRSPGAAPGGPRAPAAAARRPGPRAGLVPHPRPHPSSRPALHVPRARAALGTALLVGFLSVLRATKTVGPGGG